MTTKQLEEIMNKPFSELTEEEYQIKCKELSNQTKQACDKYWEEKK